MFDQSHLCPDHIVEMISELQKSELGDSILMKYHCWTISDPLLYRVYLKLNYPNLQEIPSAKIVNLLHNEYMQDFPPIDSDLDTHKVNFTQTFFDNQFYLFPDPIEFTLNMRKQELIDASSLNSLWSEQKSSSPYKSPAKPPAPKTTIRSKNGLKILSWKVKEIVERLGSSTYQEVADSLVKETEEFEGDSKDEKNIRRRVYDALNVLIAANVLIKNNKKVESIKKFANPIGEKLRKLKEVSEKYFTLTSLIERNSAQKSNTHSVFLPFHLVLVDKKADKAVQVMASLQKSEVSVTVNHSFEFQHSDESLRRLNQNFSLIPFDMFSLLKSDNMLAAKSLYEDSILI